MNTRPLIWVEGLIGCGKSTFCEEVGTRLNLCVMKEPVESNPYLEDFYQDQKRWAWPMQVHLLQARYAMQRAAASISVGAMPQYAGAMLDRSISGDRVFCKMHREVGNISDREWQTYESFYNIMCSSLLPPTLVIWLDCTPETALERIKARARGAEVGITLDYLRDLQRGYDELWAEAQRGLLPWSHRINVTTFHWDPISNTLPDWDSHASSIARLCEVRQG